MADNIFKYEKPFFAFPVDWDETILSSFFQFSIDTNWLPIPRGDVHSLTLGEIKSERLR